MRLKGKAVLITGASRGIGRSIAIAMAIEGADVAVNYFSQTEAAEDVAMEIQSKGRRAVAVQANVGDSASVKQMVDQIVQEFQHLDILVNNAGIMLWRKFTKVSEQELDNIIQTNLIGVFNCTRFILPYMVEQKLGKIINISSVFAFHGHSGSVPYSATKSALVGFTKALAKEVGPYGINVNALAPGYILTDISQNVSEEEKKELLSIIPLRKAGLPKDIANVAVFLASEESSYITGQVITVDGGWKI